MARFFSSKQKKVLYLLANGFCEICGKQLEKSWHADHVIPFSKGGKTKISNGQALCIKCNLSKSNNYIKIHNMKGNFKPRGWQLEARKVVIERVENESGHALVVAGVGSGKTIFSQLISQELLSQGNFDSVIIVSPTENIKYNWANSFEKDFDIPIDFNYKFKYHFNQDYKGISITYKSLESEFNTEILCSRINKKTLLIVDEVHHAGDNKSWGVGLKKIGDECGFVLLLSGTPTRSDNSKIPFVKYSKEGDLYHLVSDFEYTYADSVKDGVCCPVYFERLKSDFETIMGDDKQLTCETDEKEARKSLNMLLRVNNESCYVYQSWLKANEKLNEVNDRSNKDRAGLVICNTIDDAKKLHELISKNYGSDFAELVHSDDKDSSKKINSFKTSNKSWIISVNMVSEGVDIPRIRTILYMTNITTMLYFMQVLGRGIRNYEKIHNAIDACQMLIPDYLPLVNNAELIEESIKHIVVDIEPGIDGEPKGPRDPIITLFDDILVATCENNGNIFKGDRIDNHAATHAKSLAEQHNTTVETVLSIIKGYDEIVTPVVEVEQPSKFLSMTERKSRVKQEITKMVGKISYQFGIDFKQIHYTLNKSFGKKTNELTFKELQKKLELSSVMFNNLKLRSNGN